MDLLHSQMEKSCSLALPDGLKDLMSDISREVLRAQPTNIPEFIADYLEVLLEVREKLSIACHACNDTYKSISEPELYNEFKAIGLSDENIDIIIKIVEEHLDQKNVKEQSLLIKMARKISIDEVQLHYIRDAIQKAFKRHHIQDDILSCENKVNKVTDAIHHTLNRYKQNKTTEVYIAPNFEPSHDRSENVKEYASCDNTLDSATGKIKFVNEIVIFKTEQEDKHSDGNKVFGDGNNIDYEDDDDNISDDQIEINDEAELTDDIEENIKSISHNESSSSVNEDFVVEDIINSV